MVAPTLADPVALAAMLQSIPMARLGQPGEIGELVSFLLSGRASFIIGPRLVHHRASGLRGRWIHRALNGLRP